MPPRLQQSASMSVNGSGWRLEEKEFAKRLDRAIRLHG
jgi:hypothetical protein